MSNNIWTLQDDQFCVRYTLEDLPGFFRSELKVLPGVKAHIWSDGTIFGEVPPGTYTLDSFIEKLRFWRSAKIVDAVLAREEDLRLKFSVDDVPTAQHVLLRVELQATLLISDVGMFIKNFMGTAAEITKDMLMRWVLPIVQQGLREAIRKMTAQELVSAEVRLMLQAAMRECSEISLARYGLRLNEVHAVSLYNENFDEQLKKTGEACILAQKLDSEKTLDEVRDREAFAKIQRMEREQELEILAKNVALDGRESDVELQLRRCDIRRMMREAILSDRFDEVNNDEEFAKFMVEIDKLRLLRDDETEAFKQLYREKGADREKLAQSLAMNRKAELDQLEAEIQHAQKLQSLRHEAELTQVVRNAESDQALTDLETSISAEYLRFQDNMQKLQSRISLDAAKTDAELVERQKKHAFVQTVQADNLRTMAEIRELKARERREKMELIQQKKQQELDRDLAKMSALRGMTPAEIAASTDPENAKYIAEIEAARFNADFQQQLRDLQQQRVEDAQAAVNKTLETIQGITGQAFGAVTGYSGTGTPRVIICEACRAENPQDKKFCSNCGKQL